MGSAALVRTAILLLAAVVFSELGRRSPVDGLLVDPDALYLIVSIAAPLSTFCVGFWWRRHPRYLPVVVWTGVFLLFRLSMVDEQGVFPVLVDSTFLVEVALLVGLVVLASSLATSASSADDAHRGPGSGQLADFVHMGDELRRCLMHCRRHGRPLSAIVIEPEQLDAAADGLQRGVSGNGTRRGDGLDRTRLLDSHAARVVQSTVRRTDILVRGEHPHSIVAICPDLNSENCRILADRVRDEIAETTGLSVQCGFATFPNNALTLEDLVRRATLHIRRPQGSPSGQLFV